MDVNFVAVVMVSVTLFMGLPAAVGVGVPVMLVGANGQGLYIRKGSL